MSGEEVASVVLPDGQVAELPVTTTAAPGEDRQQWPSVVHREAMRRELARDLMLERPVPYPVVES